MGESPLWMGVEGGLSPALFQKLEKLESLGGEKTGDFFLLDQTNNKFLEKETCKL